MELPEIKNHTCLECKALEKRVKELEQAMNILSLDIRVQWINLSEKILKLFNVLNYVQFIELWNFKGKLNIMKEYNSYQRLSNDQEVDWGAWAQQYYAKREHFYLLLFMLDLIRKYNIRDGELLNFVRAKYQIFDTQNESLIDLLEKFENVDLKHLESEKERFLAMQEGEKYRTINHVEHPNSFK